MNSIYILNSLCSKHSLNRKVIIGMDNKICCKMQEIILLLALLTLPLLSNILLSSTVWNVFFTTAGWLSESMLMCIFQTGCTNSLKWRKTIYWMTDLSWAWWSTPIIPPLGRRRQEDGEFCATLNYIPSLMSAWATKWDLVILIK